MSEQLSTQSSADNFSCQAQHHVEDQQIIHACIESFFESNSTLVPISSQIHLRVEILQMKGKLLINSTLVRANGYPVHVPQPYQKSFFHNENSTHTDDMPLRLQFSDDGSLCIQLAMEIKSLSTITVSTVQSIIRELRVKIFSIYQPLQSCGLLKKYNRKSILLKKAELKMKRSVMKLLLKKSTFPQETSKKTFPPLQKKSIVTIADQITEVQASFEAPRRGGYFQIEKKTCLIRVNGKEERVELAEKVLRKNKQSNPHYCNKIQKELQIVSKIKNPKHFLNYYPQGDNTMMLTYVEDNMLSYLRKNNSIQTKIKVFSQIVDAVQELHSCGIVHRDLKPENILITEQSGNPVVKIIDFSQSVPIDKPFDEAEAKILGSTIPFSPLECTTLSKEGYNETNIDLWSLGVILYHETFGKIPITYSKCFAQDILKGWKNTGQFSIFPRLYKHSGVKSLEQMVAYLSLATIKVNPKERLQLQELRQCLHQIQEYVHAI